MAGPLFYDRVKETTTTTGTGTLTLAGAASGYVAWSTVGNANSAFYTIAHQSSNEWEVGIGTYTSSGTTLSRDKVVASSNANAAVSFSAGTKDVFVTAPAAVLTPQQVCNGRLTLTTAVAVTTSDVTAAGTIYFTPFEGNRVSLWNGNGWIVKTFSELSLALTATSGSNYDVFMYDNSGTLTLELSAAWTSDTARNNALALKDGQYVKSADNTRLYLGTFRASGTNVTEDSRSKRYLWNMFNRAPRFFHAVDTTNSWTYTTATFREANGGSTEGTSRAGVLLGLQTDVVSATSTAAADNSSSAVGVSVGVGIDSSTVNSAQVMGSAAVAVAGYKTTNAFYVGFPGLGYHTLRWLELSQAAGTTTWYGDAGVAYIQSGLTGVMYG